MRDKVILGVTLAIVLLVTLVIYTLIDTQRAPTVSAARREADATAGRQLYAQYCIQCHGPLGEGCIGPALNRAAWRPLNPDGTVNTDVDAAGTHDFIKKTLVNGRAANQPGIQMPAWSTANNGSLDDAQIEQVVTFIQYGDWSRVLESAASSTGLSEDLPSYPGFTDPAKIAQVKQVMLAKGCLNCHQLGKVGGAVGAVLSDVGSRRTADWLRQWIPNPKAVPASQRGPNLWLVAPTATVPPPAGIPASGSPVVASTPVAYPMNTTYMPTIPMTQDELNLLVDYLSHARQ